jgi:predicted ferric reductase
MEDALSIVFPISRKKVLFALDLLGCLKKLNLTRSEMHLKIRELNLKYKFKSEKSGYLTVEKLKKAGFIKYENSLYSLGSETFVDKLEKGIKDFLVTVKKESGEKE